jgi:flagellar basal-body rod modification protein FlgD
MTSISAITANSTSTVSSTTTSTADAATTQDRFLKLLVAQLNNQDPMNPMDNAQMTSQMAQLSTVEGIEQVNKSLKGMTLLQSASMVDQDVLIKGSTLTINEGSAGGAIDLPTDATSVKINILNANNTVVGTVDMGAQAAGRQQFSWDASSYTGTGALHYEVAAKNGNTALSVTSLVRDHVLSVSSDSTGMSVQLKGHNTVAYSDIQAVL